MSYSTARNNSSGALPVYYVVAPINPPFPNAHNNIGGAIPVITTGVVPVRSDSGPIPVRVTVNPGIGPWSDDQNNNNASIPVFESVAPNAMPVWHV